MADFNAYLERAEIEKEKINIDTDNEEMQQKIIDFFKSNPTPEDDAVHKLADDEGINKHEFEEIIYKLLGSILSAGKSKDFKGEYDSKEVEMGMKVEMEHTNNPLIARKIVHDHLAEKADYYSDGKAKGVFPELK